MSQNKTKTLRPDNKSKGQFKSEIEFLVAEKKRFTEVFGHVNWTALKDK